MGLWAEYTGAGLTAGTIPDQSGNGRDLVNNGVSQLASSPFTPGGVCMNFIPDLDYAYLNSGSLPSECTICLWVQPQEANPYIFSAFNAFDSLSFSGLSTNGFVENVGLTGGTLTLNNNHAIVLQIGNSGAVEIFIDDMATAAVLKTSASLSASGLFLGGWSSAGAMGSPYTYDGYIGNFCVYDTLLTEEERSSWKTTGSSAAAPVPAPAAVALSSGERYRLTLTGAADATTDVVLPMTNINARLRSGASSYLSVTLPYTTEIAAAISARANGDLQLEQLAVDNLGTETATTVVTVALETIQISRGISNSSIGLVGHRQTTNGAPASHTASAVSLQSGTTSKTAIVPGFDLSVVAGDDITVEGVTYTIGTLVLQASPAFVQTQYVEG